MTKEEKRGNGTGQISRRKFLKDAGLVVGGATVSSIGIMNACSSGIAQPHTVTDNATNNETNSVNTTVTSPPVTKVVEPNQPPAAVDLELLNPAGNQEVTQFFAPRLSTLESKTVAFLACDPTKWQPHRIFPVIMDELKKLYPTIKFLPMDQFPESTSISDDAIIKQVAARMPDAVITGSAG